MKTVSFCVCVFFAPPKNGPKNPTSSTAKQRSSMDRGALTDRQCASFWLFGQYMIVFIGIGGRCTRGVQGEDEAN